MVTHYKPQLCLTTPLQVGLIESMTCGGRDCHSYGGRCWQSSGDSVYYNRVEPASGPQPLRLRGVYSQTFCCKRRQGAFEGFQITSAKSAFTVLASGSYRLNFSPLEICLTENKQTRIKMLARFKTESGLFGEKLKRKNIKVSWLHTSLVWKKVYLNWTGDKTKKYMCYVETSNKKIMKSRDPFLSSNFPF